MRILTAALLVMATASGAAAESGTFLSPSIQLLESLEPIKNAPSVVELGSPAPKPETLAEKPANTDPARLAPLPTVIRAGDLGDPFVRITPVKASFASGGSAGASSDSSSSGSSSSSSSSDSSGTLKPM